MFLKNWTHSLQCPTREKSLYSDPRIPRFSTSLLAYALEILALEAKVCCLC